MPDRSGKPGGEGQEILKQLLGSGHEPCQADIAAYFERLSNLYEEFDYYPLPNNLLSQHLFARRESDLDVIDLSSSVSQNAGPRKALQAANEASKEAYQSIYEHHDTLQRELEFASRRGALLEQIYSQLKDLTPQEINQAPTERVLTLLGYVVGGSDATNIRNATKGIQLHPQIEEFIRGSQEGGEIRIKVLHTEEESIKKQALTLVERICEYELEGKHSGSSKHETLRAKVARLKSELVEEKARLPEQKQLCKDAHEINKTRLRPAISKMMEQLQGIKSADIKQSNLCLCDGSSMHLMETVLRSLIDAPPQTRVRSRKKQDPKKILLFSMSWDGLKALAANTGLDLGVIEGGVNAEALEAYIQHSILPRGCGDDMDKARAAVARQVGALLLNIPENPLGKAPSRQEMQKLAEVIEKYDIPLVVSDEIFATPGYRSLATYPGMARRCYVISSTSKNISAENKVAFGYSENDEFAMKVKSALDQKHYFHPPQSAGLAAMISHTPLNYYKGNQREYARKRDVVSKAMASVNRKLKLDNDTGLGWLQEPNYGYLGIISLPRNITNSAHISNSCELAEYIYKLAGVETVPIGDVGHLGSGRLGVRINFSEADDTLVSAIERIGIAIQHMQKGKYYSEIKGKKYRGDPMQATNAIGGILNAVHALYDAMIAERRQE